MAGQYMFIRQIPSSFIKDGKVTIPGDKVSSNGKVQFDINPDEQLFPATDKKGRPVPNHYNVRLESEQDLTVSFLDDTGNVTTGTRTPSQVVNAWQKNQREYAEKMGPKVWLNGVSPDMIHDSKVEMKDGSGRMMKNVSVGDPKSVPMPGKDQGYGSFLVSPDAISPTSAGDKFNVYIGRENEQVKGYSIHTDKVDENGKDVYDKPKITAGELKTQYENEIEAYKARQTPTAPSAEAEKDDGPDFT